MITTIEDAIKYLRSLDYICMPSKYTYFHHNTSYVANYDREEGKYNKAWPEVPTEDFKVKFELSCVEKDKRIQDALDYGGLEHASISYAPEKNSKLFAIRIIMPKNNLTDEEYKQLGLSDEDIKKLKSEYRGLGDIRHPKLANNEHVIMIGNITKDEVSGKDLDIVYGVREQDIISYANIVSQKLDIESVLPNDKFNRLKNRGLTSEDPNKALVVLSEFENEYNKEKGRVK